MSSAALLSLSRIIRSSSDMLALLGVWPFSVARRRKSAPSHALIMEAGQVVPVIEAEPQIWPVRRSISAQLKKPSAATLTVVLRNRSAGRGGGVGLGVGVGVGVKVGVGCV